MIANEVLIPGKAPHTMPKIVPTKTNATDSGLKTSPRA